MIMVVLVILTILTAALILIVGALMVNGVSGLKLMILGMHLTLFGGIIMIDTGTSFGGVEFYLIFTGLIISILSLIFDREPEKG